MKKMLCVILSLLLISTIFAACNNTADTEPNGTLPQVSERPSTDPTGSVGFSEMPETSEAPSTTPGSGTEPEKSLEERFADCTCELLSKAVVSSSETYFSDSGEDNATILTLLLKFPDWNTQYDCGNIRVLGEDGEALQQYNDGWKNDMEEYFAGEDSEKSAEKVYANVYLVVLPGDVDTSNLSLRLKESFGKTEADIRISESTRPLADALREVFPVSVVVLQGRAYIYTNRAAWGTNGDNIYRSLNLMPLEGGFAKTLDKSSITMTAPESDTYTVKLFVNEFDEHDLRQNKNESEFTVEVKDAYKDAEVDYNAVFKEITINVEDGSGNIMVLRFDW